MKDYWYDRVQVSIFLCVDKSLYPNCAGAATTPAQRDALKAQLEQMKPPVKEVFYETQGEAYQRFKDQFRNSPLGEQATERAVRRLVPGLADRREQVRRHRQLVPGRAGRRARSRTRSSCSTSSSRS